MTKTFKQYLQETEQGYMEETYDGDDFYANYGEMWYNDDFLDEASKPEFTWLDLAHARRRGRIPIIVQKI